MQRCRSCRSPLRGSRRRIGARCPQCRRPLYEPAADEVDSRARGPAQGLCAVHPASGAIGTCPRCGNFLCAVCRTRWRGRSLCVACVERALEANEAAPEEVRAHLRQAVLALVFGLAAWGMALVAVLFVAMGMSAGEGGPAYLSV